MTELINENMDPKHKQHINKKYKKVKINLIPIREIKIIQRFIYFCNFS